MTDNQKTNVTVSFNFSCMLGLAFIVLKLCHVIEWAWIWVLAPIWIPFALLTLLLLIIGIIALFATRP